MGTFLDLGSTDNYVTHKYAKKHKLHGEEVDLEVEGIGGKKSYVQSKVYTVPILIKGRAHEIECYGLDVISSVTPPPKMGSYAAMCSRFGIKPEEVKRPSKIDLLISMWDNSIHPSKIKTIGKMILYQGPLGKVFGGRCAELDFIPFVVSYPVSVRPLIPEAVRSTTLRATVREYVYTTPAKTEQEILEFFQEESIGVECSPRCGGCRCGKCATGSKQMSLKHKREYEHFKSLMVLDEKGTDDDPGPY